MRPLAICAIIRDEAPNLAEWIEFHRLVGVTQFVIYDDRSTDDSLLVLQRRNSGDIVVHQYNDGDDGWHNARYWGPTDHSLLFAKVPQCCAYNHYACHHAGDHWAAFIDVDEFLYDTEGRSVPQALESLEDRKAAVVNWLVFGSNGHQTRPAGLTVNAYTARGKCGHPEPWGRHIKTIVNMNNQPFWGEAGSHLPHIDGLTVDQHGLVVQHGWAHTPSPVDAGLVLNHYYHRSHAEAAAKISRKDRNAPPFHQPDASRLAAHDRNEVRDERILRYLKPLQAALCD